MYPVYRFNRYIVECKVSTLTYGNIHMKWFNRYIVECKGYCFSGFTAFPLPDLIDTLWNVKVSYVDFRLSAVPRFNRYIVECKGGWVFIETFWRFDLIDTLWNVKVYRRRDAIYHFQDLIDTLWNVKDCDCERNGFLGYRFNRYIVECKALAFATSIHAFVDLIDTLWNVK